MASKLTQIKKENEYERALLISVDTGDFDAEISANELTELVKTAGAFSCCCRFRQAKSQASWRKTALFFRANTRKAASKWMCLQKFHILIKLRIIFCLNKS